MHPPRFSSASQHCPRLPPPSASAARKRPAGAHEAAKCTRSAGSAQNARHAQSTRTASGCLRAAKRIKKKSVAAYCRDRTAIFRTVRSFSPPAFPSITRKWTKRAAGGASSRYGKNEDSSEIIQLQALTASFAAFSPAIWPKTKQSRTALPPTRFVPWMPPVISPAA